MKDWGFQGSDTCVLCDVCVETRDHLFSTCCYFKVAFEQLFGLYTNFRPRNREDGLNWVIKNFGWKGEEAAAGRLIWQSVLSHTWRERCNRAFGADRKDVKALVRIVKMEVKLLGWELFAQKIWVRG
ncbi:unnamed protein product [Linum trigynum]|uniref:Reverse transcriptase zinc-binding domain-containing protein n=1 Tax=Linum trigynum TaxID=586398 RepID=A0AAV2ETU8_9ROSI